MQKNKILSCRHLVIGYKNKPLGTIDCELSSGDVLSISGGNGSGKTTFIKTILGLTPSLGGEVDWSVEDNSIEYLPQISHEDQFFSYTMHEILNLFKVGNQWLKTLSKDFLVKRWNDASGGEKQKALILTKLTRDVKVLILDEPLNHLDKDNKVVVSQMLSGIYQQNPHLVMIIISHQPLEDKKLFNQEICL